MENGKSVKSQPDHQVTLEMGQKVLPSLYLCCFVWDLRGGSPRMIVMRLCWQRQETIMQNSHPSQGLHLAHYSIIQDI